ncbi:MAG: hypothetical protein DRP15_03295, partial [Candidatus Aenigmatarchaeota archaeon]
MPVERMTAKKVTIADIINGRWIKAEGLEPSYVICRSGQKISRARILGTVVAKFVSDDENFASITIDDGTETIRAKTFKTLKPIDKVNIGDIVDMIGKVREYNGEIYIMPEIIRVIDDPNYELLRKLEIITITKSLGTQPEPVKERDVSELKKKIMEIIEEEKDGINYTQLVERSGATEQEVEEVVNEL